MARSDLCCGQVPKRKKNTVSENLPENPIITKGIEVIYLGAGDLKIVGKTSGLIYYVSDHRRRFFADPDDVSNILKLGDLILKP